jgi:hypothetical protein
MLGPLVIAGLGLTELLCSSSSDHHAAHAKINIGKSLNKAGKSVSNAADKAVDTGKDIAKGAEDTASSTWKDVSKTTKKECDSIAKTAQKTYASTKGALEKSYQDALKQMEKVLTAAQMEAYKALARVFYKDHLDEINAVSVRWVALMKQTDFSERVLRVMRQAAERKIDEKSREDLLYITRELLGEYGDSETSGELRFKKDLDLGFPVEESPYVAVAASADGGKPKKIKWLRSLTLMLAAEAGTGNVGVQTAIGMSVDIYKRSGRKYVECKLLAEAGPIIGLSMGVQGGIAIGLWPTWTADNPGASFGIYGGAAKEGLGLGASIIWNFTSTWSVNASPGITIGPQEGEGAQLGIVTGWTQDVGPSGWK